MFTSQKHIFGLFFGMFAGLAFAVTAWGMDAYLLAGAHYAYPWFSFLPGVAAAVILYGFVGWLTVKLESNLFGLFIWTVVGVGVAGLGVWLPLVLSPRLILMQEPALQGWLAFPWYDSYYTLFGLSAAFVGIASAVLGLLENALVEQAHFTVGYGTFILILVFSAVVMGMVGFSVDYMVNSPYRTPVINLDNLFAFAIDNRDVELDKTLARRMRMGAVSSISENLLRPRRLFYFDFTETVDQLRVLVDFDGQWAMCITVAEQPINCTPVEPPANP